MSDGGSFYIVCTTRGAKVQSILTFKGRESVRNGKAKKLEYSVYSMWVVVLWLHFRRMENGRGGTLYYAENENVCTLYSNVYRFGRYIFSYFIAKIQYDQILGKGVND
jgi:hypothetical protein